MDILISGQLSNQQAGVNAAKCKILNGCNINLLFDESWNVMNHRAAFINIFEIKRRRDKTFLHHLKRQYRFNGAAGCHRMSHVALQRDHKGIRSENCVDGLRFNNVSHLGGRGVSAH